MPSRPPHARVCGGLLILLGWLMAGCQTAPPPPALDISQPGWRAQRFPALWRPPGGNAPELAGDLFLARHADGRASICFTKVPFPTVTAWRAPGQWRIEIQPQNRRSAGRGLPPARYLLLHLPEALDAAPLPAELEKEDAAGAARPLRLRHRQTGETLAIFPPP